MLTLCTAVSLAAQEPVRPNLDGFKYPALARAARIEGTVEFVVNADGIELVSGHPMLAAAAKSNLEKWAIPLPTDTPLSVTYIFRLTGDFVQNVEVDEPIGDRFDRFFLRLFHRPAVRRVKKVTCIESKDSSAPVSDKIKHDLSGIEIDIEAGSLCIQTDVATIASLRR